MKYLKKYEELVKESTVFSKREMIDLLLTEMDAKMYGEDEFRKDLEDLSYDKFDELVRQYGYKELTDGYWTPDYSRKVLR